MAASDSVPSQNATPLACYNFDESELITASASLEWKSMETINWISYYLNNVDIYYQAHGEWYFYLSEKQYTSTSYKQNSPTAQMSNSQLLFSQNTALWQPKERKIPVIMQQHEYKWSD